MDIYNLSLPHPVLGLGDDIDGKYEILSEKEIFSDRIILMVDHVLNNVTLKEMIKRSDAIFGCEINCPQTIYRKMFLSGKPKQEIILNSDDVRGKVIINFYILAHGTPKKYKPSPLNTDYDDSEFLVSDGEVLAYGGSTYFYAEKKWKEAESVSSFMCIIRSDKKEGPVEYELMSDRINICLPEEDFFNYQNTPSGFMKIYNVYHGALVYPALVYALIRIFNNSEGDEMLTSYLWYDQLNDRIQSDSRFKNIERTVENAPLFAQTLLSNKDSGMPLSRTLKCVRDIAEDTYKFNDE